ncbi:methyltransferase domain-containing protein [Candidatus Woesearchaeota archaeon]|nr:methyltransferase domain-containing protein [Candidatus Woesearchaeota archaeon]
MTDQYHNAAGSWTGGKPRLLSDFTVRPYVINECGDVRGRRVLDIGCGAGSIARVLADSGAEVCGFDKSEAMIEKARSLPSDGIEYKVFELTADSGLPFEGHFDAAVSSMVWGPCPLDVVDNGNRLVSESLDQGGRYIIAIAHPDMANYKPDSKWIKVLSKGYHQNGDEVKFKVYDADSKEIPLEGSHLTLEFMLQNLINYGFQLENIQAPKPTENDRKTYPEMWSPDDFRIPFFSIITARKD